VGLESMRLACKINVGKRVSLHPATDRWMRGDRHGEIVGLGHSREYIDTFTKEKYFTRPYLVLMDVSTDRIRVHPENLNFLDDDTKGES